MPQLCINNLYNVSAMAMEYMLAVFLFLIMSTALKRCLANESDGVGGESFIAGSTERISIGAVGDILLHESLQVQASQEPQRHRHLWHAIKGLLKEVDVMYGNLEGPIAYGLGLQGNPKTKKAAFAAGPSGCTEMEDQHHFDGYVYTGFPRFNFNEGLAKDMALDGIDVVTTANNHALDRCSRGINRTLAALRAAGIRWTGTRQTVTEPWHASSNTSNVTVAWLGCTSAGIPIQKDWNAKSAAVLKCDNTTAIKLMVKELKESHDAVIVLPHWGEEYATEPEQWQRDSAHAWLEAGAIAILGNHAHVTQAAETYLTSEGRRALIAYSLGNFISHQGWKGRGKNELAKRSSPFVLLGLEKACRHRRCTTTLTEWNYVPLFVWRQEAARCSECKCPKALGESIIKAKQRCPQFHVMATDKSNSSIARKASQWVQSRMGPVHSLPYDEAIRWAKAWGRTPTPASTPLR